MKTVPLCTIERTVTHTILLTRDKSLSIAMQHIMTELNSNGKPEVAYTEDEKILLAAYKILAKGSRFARYSKCGGRS